MELLHTRASNTRYDCARCLLLIFYVYYSRSAVKTELKNIYNNTSSLYFILKNFIIQGRILWLDD